MKLLVFMICLASFSGHAEGAREKTAGKRRPNVIVLLTDDQSYYTLKATGNTFVISPHLDSLVSEGMFFSGNYSTTAICMASRATLLTGKLEYGTGTNFMHGAMTRAVFEESYPVLLRKNGYYVGFAGKFGFAVTPEPDRDEGHETYDRLPVRDFDWWAGGVGQTSYDTRKNRYLEPYAAEFPHSTAAYGQAACDFIDLAIEKDKPFCLSLFFKAPHMPFDPDPAYDSVYRDTVFPFPPNFGKKNAAHLPLQSRLGRQNTRWATWWNEENYQTSARKYYQLLYGVDRVLGRIKNKLRQEGIWENTIIIFTSDNGYNMGAHGLGDKVLGYEEGSKTPLVIFDPVHGSRTKGKAYAGLTGNIDIAPTILDAAGIAIPAAMDGLSLLPVLKGEAPDSNRALPLIQAWGSAPTLSMGVLWKKWKYLYWPYADGMPAAEELYDLTNDPFEMNNLLSSPVTEEILVRMRSLYDKEIQKWQQSAVPYNDYTCFGTIFDRAASWPEKKAVIPKSFYDFYEKDLQDAGIAAPPYDYKRVLAEVESKYR